MPSTPYRTYKAMVSQSSTADPVATEKANNLGATLAWARTGVGTYTVTATEPVFTADKTVVKVNGPLSGLKRIDYALTSTTVITFTSSELVAEQADPADDIISKALVEINVFTS